MKGASALFLRAALVPLLNKATSALFVRVSFVPFLLTNLRRALLIVVVDLATIVFAVYTRIRAQQSKRSEHRH